MGYNGEKASLNQYSDLLDYCEKNVVEDLQSIFNENLQEEIVLKKDVLSFIYEPKPISGVPLLSFDGGMATLFARRMTETCLLKVAGACPPEFAADFDQTKIKEIFFHTFVGQLNYISSVESTKAEVEAVIQRELDRLLKVEEFITLLATFNVEVKHFSEKFKTLVSNWKDKSTIKDSFRELLEWALIIDFIVSNKSNTDKKIPFLIIKDGNLSSNAKAITGTLAEKIKEFIKGDNDLVPVPYIVGAVKSSRYTGENLMGTIVSKLAAEIPTHCFFKLPKRYEAAIDKDFANNSFKRYFLNLFAGTHVFEIQIPNPLADNEETRDQILDLIASQITFEYGGSIATNSFAHVRASLSEAEGQILESTIAEELKKGEKNE